MAHGGMSLGVHALTLLAVLGSAAAVRAGNLPIKGSYGNKDGCAYAKSGQSTGSDNFFLLTAEAITTAASVCTVKKVIKTDGKSLVATVSCQAEGEEAEAEDTAEIKYGPKGYTISLTGDKQTKWGPLPLCN